MKISLIPKRKLSPQEAETATISGSPELAYYASVVESKVAKTAPVIDLTAHEADTTVHGATGAVVGTTNTQTLTNKTVGSDLAVSEGVNVVLGTTTGTKIGTATTQKLGFYNSTPVVKPSAYTQTYATADKTHAAETSANFPAGGTGAAEGGWNTAANRDLAIARFDALRADVADLKQLVNSIIDDLQSLGLVA